MKVKTHFSENLLQVVDRYPRHVLITDDNLAEIYHSLMSRFTTIVVPSGETSKSRECKSFVEDQLMELGINRGDLLIAFGGGVITDLVGFVAATYMRGIDYISIPTTLMGMVDAAIGGKTGINTSFGKNTIGAFYRPKQIIIEDAFLETLPQEEFRSGMQEVLKYGLIWDRNLWDTINNRSYEIKSLIDRCIAIKEEIVEKDFCEQGIRRILNFGHTIGHGIERLSGYTISHGKAIWMGMLLESRLSEKLGFLSKSACNAIEDLLLRVDIKFELKLDFSGNTLYEAMRSDKKASRQSPRIILLRQIGEVESFGGEYCTPLKKEEFLNLFQYIRDGK